MILRVHAHGLAIGAHGEKERCIGSGSGVRDDLHVPVRKSFIQDHPETYEKSLITCETAVLNDTDSHFSYCHTSQVSTDPGKTSNVKDEPEQRIGAFFPSCNPGRRRSSSLLQQKTRITWNLHGVVRYCFTYFSGVPQHS